jgi:hypothetical protein
MSDERPILGEGADQARAIAAAEEFATGLQAGMDEADADVYDQQFAGDVLWGSPTA